MRHAHMNGTYRNMKYLPHREQFVFNIKTSQVKMTTEIIAACSEIRVKCGIVLGKRWNFKGYRKWSLSMTGLPVCDLRSLIVAKQAPSYSLMTEQASSEVRRQTN